MTFFIPEFTINFSSVYIPQIEEIDVIVDNLSYKSNLLNFVINHDSIQLTNYLLLHYCINNSIYYHCETCYISIVTLSPLVI